MPHVESHAFPFPGFKIGLVDPALCGLSCPAYPLPHTSLRSTGCLIGKVRIHPQKFVEEGVWIIR